MANSGSLIKTKSLLKDKLDHFNKTIFPKLLASWDQGMDDIN